MRDGFGIDRNVGEDTSEGGAFGIDVDDRQALATGHVAGQLEAPEISIRFALVVHDGKDLGGRWCGQHRERHGRGGAVKFHFHDAPSSGVDRRREVHGMLLRPVNK